MSTLLSIAVETTIDMAMLQLRTAAILCRINGKNLSDDPMSNWRQGKIDALFNVFEHDTELPLVLRDKLMAAKHEANFLMYGDIWEVRR